MSSPKQASGAQERPDDSAQTVDESTSFRDIHGRPVVIPPDVLAAMKAGRPMEQRCPNCGLTEASGFFCSRCTTRTGPLFWQRRALSPDGATALQKARAARHKRPLTQRTARGERGQTLWPSDDPTPAPGTRVEVGHD